MAAGTFVAPFSLGRMTWIKPSFMWMMYRGGWATKPDQERVLAIRIARDGFERISAGGPGCDVGCPPPVARSQTVGAAT